jgi:hypothetical protein
VSAFPSLDWAEGRAISVRVEQVAEAAALLRGLGHEPLAPGPRDRVLIRVLVGVLGAWVLVAALAAVFQRQLIHLPDSTVPTLPDPTWRRSPSTPRTA